MNCSSCSQHCQDASAITCVKCTLKFHHTCVGMSEKDFKKLLPMNKKKFKCPTCKIKQHTKIASSPTSSMTSGSEIFPIDFERYVTHIDEKIDKFATSFSEKIRSDLKELIVSSVSTELGAINTKITSLDNMSSKLPELQNRMDSIIQTYETKLAEVHTRCDELAAELHIYKTKVEDMEQSNRQCNIEIQNVPENRAENVLNIVGNLGTALNVPIPLEQVASAHRVRAHVPSARPRNIVVRLSTQRLRDDIIAAARVRRGLTAESLQIPGATQRVYVNEHLTLCNKILYAKARRAQQEKNYEFVWIKNGHIFARKTSGSKFMIIKSENDVLKM